MIKTFKERLFFLIFFGLIIYSSSLNGPFLFDDERSIIQETRVIDLDRAIKNFSFLDFRYLSRLSFAINFQLSGQQTFFYHLVNVIIHISASLVAWQLAQIIFGLKNKKNYLYKNKEFLGFLVGLIFLTHPIQTQAVSYIAQRFTSMAGLFYLLTLFLYLKTKINYLKERFTDTTIIYLVLSFLSGIAALYSKASALSLPLMILLLELGFFSKLNKKNFIKLFLGLIGTACLILGVILNRGDVKFNKIIISPLGEEIVWSNYLLTQTRVILKYLQLLFLPVRQTADYYFPISTTILDLRVIISSLIILIIIILGLYFYFKKNNFVFKILSFSILSFFIFLSVESSILPIDDVIFEHRLYLPTFSFGLFLISSISLIQKKLKINFNNFLIILISLYALLAFNRNFIWTNEIKFWADVVKKAPLKAKGHGALGVAYDKAERLDEAIAAYEKSAELNPNLADLYLKLHNNLGYSYFKKDDYQKAQEHYKKVLEIAPNFVQTKLNLAQLYLKTNQLESAITELEDVIEIQPNAAIAYHNLAAAYFELQNYAAAKINIQKALELKPQLAQSQYLYKKIIEAEQAHPTNPH